MAAATKTDAYDRARALQEFDDTKSGVKGLVDSGITAVPSFFHHPNLIPNLLLPQHNSIPVISLSLPRPQLTNLICAAARSPGFFQLTDHDIPPSLMDRSISAVRSFHSLPAETRGAFYSRDFQSGFSYASNYDLFRTAAASWRDTVQIRFGPVRPDMEKVPEVMREEMAELDERVREAGRWVMGVLSEGLGVEAGRLEGMTCHEGRLMVCNYYPWCPQPDRTVGIPAHTDPGVVTLLVQDGVGGWMWSRCRGR